MHHSYDDTGADDDFSRPSKSQLKRDMHDLQSLGEDLLTLPASRLEPLNLPEILLDAIKAAKKITNFEGRRRQMQYIGKLMRKIDAEPVRQAVADFKLGRAQDSLTLHESEAWRERLLAQDEALQDFIGQHPGVDVQQLRSLVRAARKDASVAPEQRSGRAFRELFQFIKAEAKRVAQEASAEGLDGDGDGDE
ncbi:ribosome biogenesis factor YjgA [Roseateles flavus]|uniref:Dual-action ribosomal maturation protein DarP n=1 Tax=Roseateles flavus TaxID=3149041 RepID=A0ABV0GEE8_9BURK